MEEIEDKKGKRMIGKDSYNLKRKEKETEVWYWQR